MSARDPLAGCRQKQDVIAMKHIQILLIVLLFSLRASGQVTVALTIENQVIDGTDFLFDIYLTRAPESEGDIYLGNADLVIEFNAQMFSGTVLTKSGQAPGYCTFTPSSSLPADHLFTQSTYFNSTAVDIDGNQLIINVNGPTPGDEAAFLSSVAKIDALPSTHRLGRFRISGVSDPDANANLQWKTTGSGLKTMVFSLNQNNPYDSNQIEVETDVNTCPESLELDQVSILPGLYQASSQLSALGSILSPASVTLSAGQEVTLQPGFEIAQGGTLLIRIQGCE
jgi:hypothetical protein